MKKLVLIIALIFLISNVSALSQYDYTSGEKSIVVFNGTSGTTTWTVPMNVYSLEALVVAGGAGGGSNHGGGGGAGGLIHNLSISVTPGDIIDLSLGSGGTSNNNGGHSYIRNLTKGINETAIGGGAGGAGGNSDPGSDGGSGGGGGSGCDGGSGGLAGAATSGQGYAGGRDYHTSGYEAQPGGGGFGGLGQLASGTNNATGGNGGDCINLTITGESKPYAAGGGGASYSGDGPSGTGGCGIGGTGGESCSAGASATANTGSGGGGGGCGGAAGGTGSAGIIIFSYTESTSPVSDFTTDVTSGAAPLTVQFTDTSTNTPTSWLWDFGEGNTSTEQNPSHEFGACGTSFTVALTATNDDGSDTETKTDYITTNACPTPTPTPTTTAPTPTPTRPPGPGADCSDWPDIVITMLMMLPVIEVAIGIYLIARYALEPGIPLLEKLMGIGEGLIFGAVIVGVSIAVFNMIFAGC